MLLYKTAMRKSLVYGGVCVCRGGGLLMRNTEPQHPVLGSQC